MIKVEHEVGLGPGRLILLLKQRTIAVQNTDEWQAFYAPIAENTSKLSITCPALRRTGFRS